MSLKDGLLSNLTCLVYVLYLGKLIVGGWVVYFFETQCSFN